MSSTRRGTVSNLLVPMHARLMPCGGQLLSFPDPPLRRPSGPRSIGTPESASAGSATPHAAPAALLKKRRRVGLRAVAAVSSNARCCVRAIGGADSVVDVFVQNCSQ